MAKAQNRWYQVSARGHQKVEMLPAGDDCVAPRAFVAGAIIWRAQARKGQVLIYIKTWRRTGVESVDCITSAWVALGWRTR